MIRRDDAQSRELFRSIATRDLSDATLKGLATWLPERQVLAEDTRPQTARGRDYEGFVETLYRVLAWYKPKKIQIFHDLGWRLDNDAQSRVHQALKRLADQAVELEPTHTRAAWLRAFDPTLIARYTAMDHRFQTVTQRPIERVLDFGSGIGRNVYLWATAARVTSVDAIESLYLLQRDSYSALYGSGFVEYLDSANAYREALTTAPQVLHLPTWRLPDLAAESFDLIVAVQVLQELNESTLRFVLDQFRRLVRPRGLLYIRDAEFWTPMHHVRVGRELLRAGWRLTFRYPGDDRSEIEGLPRLWVYTGEDTSRYFRLGSRLRRWLLPSYRDSYDAWRDFGLPL